MKVLFAGLGSIGQRHLRNLRSLAPVEVVAYRRRGCELPAELQGESLTTYGDLTEALAQRPEAAFICSPPAAQMGLALAAARAGCHLFVEKPIADSMDGARELISVVRQQKLVTLVGYNLRFHPGLRQVKAWLDQERIGRVTTIRAEVGQYLPDWHPWEDYRQGYSARRDLGGGVILDLIHELDYARWLMGEVAEVACFAERLTGLEIDTEDTAEILLRYESGTLGSVHLDYVQRTPSRTCQIIGEQGTILLDFSTQEARLYEQQKEAWQVAAPEDAARNTMYLDLMQHFLECIEGRAASLVDLEEGLSVLKLALAAREAAETGRVVPCGAIRHTGGDS